MPLTPAASIAGVTPGTPINASSSWAAKAWSKSGSDVRGSPRGRVASATLGARLDCNLELKVAPTGPWKTCQQSTSILTTGKFKTSSLTGGRPSGDSHGSSRHQQTTRDRAISIVGSVNVVLMLADLGILYQVCRVPDRAELT